MRTFTCVCTCFCVYINCTYVLIHFRFFLQEVQTGESLIAAGDIENGVEHLANAVVVCGQPAQLLQVLQQALPAQVFTMLIQRMRTMGNPSDAAEPKEAMIEDYNDDLE